MSIRKRLPLIPVLLALVLAASTSGKAGFVTADVPLRLTDQEFWRLTVDLSEPNGAFRSENLLSNEMAFAALLPEVLAKGKPGGVYMGVGPEQNFTYIAALKPKMAFITDIRRGNLHVLLMYKAIFEMSKDRAQFISLLFTKARPSTLTATSSIAEIMDTYWETPSGDEKAYTANLDAILNHLTKTHTIPLDAEDRDGVSRSYRAFYAYGPAMDYSATTALNVQGGGGRAATYRDLMKQTDENGKPLTYLGSESSFGIVKDLFSKNLIVPLVGNFSGPKTIRAIGDYVRGKGATVSAFYLSSVEPYLRRDGSQPIFCANAATLPITESSIFIRTGAGASNSAMVPAGARIGSYQNGAVGPMLNGCGSPATSSLRPVARRTPLAPR